MSTALAAAYRRHVITGDRPGALPYYITGLREGRPEVVDRPEPWFSVAELLAEREQYDTAIACATKAVILDQRDPRACKNLGSILARAQRYDEAQIWLDKARSLAPDDATIALDLAVLAYHQGQLDESEALFAEAVMGAADDLVRAKLYMHWAYPVLARGDLQRGLALYEHRFSQLALTQVWELGAPPWNGEELAGKHILVHHDQGIGDDLQFCRFLPELACQAARLTVAVPRDLVALLNDLEWPDPADCDCQLEILDIEGDLPVPDFHSPMCSYLRHINFDISAVSVPYLTTLGECDMHRRRAETTRLAVGLVWAPRPLGEISRRRAVPLGKLLELATIPGVQLFGLQVGEAAGDIARLDADILVHDLSRRLRDWSDTAAYMTELDLVVSVDTAPLHLAGALGRPCIGLLPYSPCWRWGFNTEKTPWYSSMTLLRQDKPGDWSGPLWQLRLRIEAMARQPVERVAPIGIEWQGDAVAA